MNIYVLGDIHGRAKALKQVFERSGFDKHEDQLIFVGDIVDRGEEPFECIEMLMEVKNLIAITGNHDVNFHQWIITGRDFFNGKHGVAITKQIWNLEGDLERKENCIRYFEKTVPYYIDTKNRIFTHGGFNNTISIESQDESNMCWDRELWEDALKLGSGGRIKTKENFYEIYIGHTITAQYGAKEEISMGGIILSIGEPITVPMYFGGVCNMDTGAGYDVGKLSMLNVETKVLFQSDKIVDIYGTH